MRFFIYLLVISQYCFASLDIVVETPAGTDERKKPQLSRTTCPRTLSFELLELVSKEAKPNVMILDMDEVLVTTTLDYRRRRVIIATSLGQKLNILFGRPDFCEKIHGLVILTSRPAREFCTRQPLRTFSEEENDFLRTSVMAEAWYTLQLHVPNIFEFLRSENNFAGHLPDGQIYREDELYRSNGYTIYEDCPHGIMWKHGVIVMGGALSPEGQIYDKYSAFREFILDIKEMPDDYRTIYIDDVERWLRDFEENGSIADKLFHYEFPKSSDEQLNKMFPDRHPNRFDIEILPPSADSKTIAAVTVAQPKKTSFVYSAFRYALGLTIIACVVNRVSSLRQCSIVQKAGMVAQSIANIFVCAKSLLMQS